MQRIDFNAMGVTVTVFMDTPAPEIAQELAMIPQWFSYWEQVLSRFQPDSELSRLNESPGSWHKVSSTFWMALMAAQDAAQLSDGLVRPLIGAAMLVIGYDRCFKQIVQAHSNTLPRTVSIPVWQSLQYDSEHQAVRLPVGTRLDLGGTAKGWVAQQTCDWLSRFAPTLVSVGGDIAISDPRSDGSAWPIGVADPALPEHAVETLYLAQGAVATSGQDYRTWMQGSERQHHIIDPRTGLPAATDILTVTAIAPTSVAAEAVAKTVFILGSVDGLAWVAERPEYAALLQCLDGRQIRSETLAHYTWNGALHA